MLERMVSRFSVWFSSAGSVWQTTIVVLLWVLVEQIFPQLDPHGFLLLYVLTVYSAITQPALAFASDKAAQEASNVSETIKKMVTSQVHVVQAMQAVISEIDAKAHDIEANTDVMRQMLSSSSIVPMSPVLGALGVVAGNPPQTRLVTPYQDAHQAFLAFLASAKVSIRFVIYGATYAPFFDALIAARARGVKVQGIFDHTQSTGKAEQAQLDRLVAGGFRDGVDFLIGTSPAQHQICHIKATWIDGRYVEDGSLNYSTSAFQQVQTVCFSDWPEWTSYLDTVFDRLWAWILANEPQYQTLSSHDT